MGIGNLTIDKDKILERIQALELELTGLKAELNKPNKFEFKYSYKECFFIGSSWVSTKMEGTDSDALASFRYRQTESNAIADLKLEKELMCIGALAEQLNPDYKSKIKWDGTHNYFIMYNYNVGEYEVACYNSYRPLGIVFMPQEVATQVCKILNNKGVEL